MDRAQIARAVTAGRRVIPAVSAPNATTPPVSTVVMKAKRTVRRKRTIRIRGRVVILCTMGQTVEKVADLVKFGGKIVFRK